MSSAVKSTSGTYAAAAAKQPSAVVAPACSLPTPVVAKPLVVTTQVLSTVSIPKPSAITQLDSPNKKYNPEKMKINVSNNLKCYPNAHKGLSSYMVSLSLLVTSDEAP
jgi:hypothetical protein